MNPSAPTEPDANGACRTVATAERATLDERGVTEGGVVGERKARTT
jgi:hypothetical protein